MFRSIRWRLVLSYVILIALTLGVVESVVLRLVEDYVEQQEVEYLAANAQAVADQAQVLIGSTGRWAELQELAEMSSFLGNARVTIFDANRQVVADSEQGESWNAAWILVSQEVQSDFERTEASFDPFVIEMPTGRKMILPASWEEQRFIIEQLSPKEALTLLRWQDGAWGSGFRFDVIEDPAQLHDLSVRVRRAPRSERVITVPIGERIAPLGFVEIGNGPDFTARALETIRHAFLYAAAGGLLLAVILGLVVSRGLTAPLRKLTEVAGQMSGGDLSIRVPLKGKDEIGQLAGQFNRMAERLESSFGDLAAERDALRCFIADASHELRTPITALRNFNDLLQGAAVDDPVARTEFLAESQVQIDRLELVTRDLLDLSRLDAGLVALDLDDHDVGELIEAAASAFKVLAQENEIALSLWPPMPPVQLRCDRARIELALSNLLDNALKFTPSGGQVGIGAEQMDDVVRLWVRDNGPGIAVEEQPHVFERFYRGRGNHTEGSGLGLAIVKSVVLAHGGQVSVESEPGAGCLFIIELPQA